MPKYGYVCLDCGLRFVKDVAMNSRGQVKCECGGKTKIIIGAVRSVWKGGKPSDKS